MKIVTNEAICKSQWEELLFLNPFASPFQTPKFYSFCRSLNEISAEAIGVYDSNKLLSVVVIVLAKENGIKSYFSRRGIIYGGPILGDRNSSHLLIKSISKIYKNKLIYIESRNYFDYKEYLPVFKAENWTYQPWLNFQLSINSLDNIKRNMSESRWRQIKKAKKAGAYWSEAKSIDDINAFYEILLSLYRRKIKKPLPPFNFFKEFFNQKIGVYLLIYHENKVIGGIMCAILPNKTIYEYYVCGLDEDYKSFYPSVMATWAAIEYALQNDIKTFDFMGAGAKNETYGVREFKARFGGQEVEDGRYTRILNPFLYNLGKLGLKIISKIK